MAHGGGCSRNPSLYCRKGSVAIDGVSLTIAYVDEQIFKVSVIPHTQEETTLVKKKIGDVVNLENDMIVKYVEKLMGQGKPKGGLTLISWWPMAFKPVRMILIMDRIKN